MESSSVAAWCRGDGSGRGRGWEEGDMRGSLHEAMMAALTEGGSWAGLQLSPGAYDYGAMAGGLHGEAAMVADVMLTSLVLVIFFGLYILSHIGRFRFLMRFGTDRS